MSIESLTEAEKWARFHQAHEEIEDVLAARKVRHIIETAVVPRVGYMLQGTLKGEPVQACTHLVDPPGFETARGAVIDWMCEGVGLLCKRCAAGHLCDDSTPHRDPRHEVCIRCGYRDDDHLHGLGAWVALRQPLPIRSEMLKADEEITGRRMALGYVGTLATTPIAWACTEHRDLFESASGRDLLTLHWPPLPPMERMVTRLPRKPKTPKGKGGEGKKGGRKRR